MAESEQGTGWHMHPKFDFAHRGEAGCVGRRVPVLVVPVGEARETIARALCRCGAEEVNLPHRYDCPAQKTERVFAALAATPPETEETRCVCGSHAIRPYPNDTGPHSTTECPPVSEGGRGDG